MQGVHFSGRNAAAAMLAAPLLLLVVHRLRRQREMGVCKDHEEAEGIATSDPPTKAGCQEEKGNSGSGEAAEAVNAASVDVPNVKATASAIVLTPPTPSPHTPGPAPPLVRPALHQPPVLSADADAEGAALRRRPQALRRERDLPPRPDADPRRPQLAPHATIPSSDHAGDTGETGEQHATAAIISRADLVQAAQDRRRGTASADTRRRPHTMAPGAGGRYGAAGASPGGRYSPMARSPARDGGSGRYGSIASSARRLTTALQPASPPSPNAEDRSEEDDSSFSRSSPRSRRRWSTWSTPTSGVDLAAAPAAPAAPVRVVAEGWSVLERVAQRDAQAARVR